MLRSLKVSLSFRFSKMYFICLSYLLYYENVTLIPISTTKIEIKCEWWKILRKTKSIIFNRLCLIVFLLICLYALLCLYPNFSMCPQSHLTFTRFSLSWIYFLWLPIRKNLGCQLLTSMYTLCIFNLCEPFVTCCLHEQIKEVEMGGGRGTEEMRAAYKILVGNLKGRD